MGLVIQGFSLRVRFQTTAISCSVKVISLALADIQAASDVFFPIGTDFG